MEWIFDNLYVVLIVVGALISWLKNRSESQAETLDEERAREELIRGLEELQRPAPRTPPPLPGHQHHAPPPVLRQPKPESIEIDPYAQDDASLRRQQEMQEKLAALRRHQEETGKLARQARAKRLSGAPETGRLRRNTDTGQPRLRDILGSPSQSRRAILLREILGPPVALK